LKLSDLEFKGGSYLGQKNIYIILAVVIILFISWNVFSKPTPNDGGGVDDIKSGLQSVGTELDKTRAAIEESQRDVEQLQQYNNEAQQSIRDSQAVGTSSSEIIRRDKQILIDIRKRSQEGN